MKELNLWLDSYDDIYSDFDSRHYNKRRVSEDFIYELRKEMKFREQQADSLILSLPEVVRNEASEKIIPQSLAGFFTSQYELFVKLYKKRWRTGILFLIGGVIMMLLNAWLTFSLRQSFWLVSIKVILEPGGWFLLWTALEILYFDLKEIKKDRQFYQLLSSIRISFRSS